MDSSSLLDEEPGVRRLTKDKENYVPVVERTRPNAGQITISKETRQRQ